MTKAFVLVLWLWVAIPGHATDLVQRVGGALPLQTTLTDERGHDVQLARYFGDGPVVLVFGYYRCPTLCTTLMDGVLMSLSASGLDPAAYRVVGIGIDPRERAQDAAARAAAYGQAYANVRLSLLTGTEAATRELARAAGVTYAYDTRYAQYSHPLAFVVATPEGRISRYFPGVAFDPREVRLALVEASDARIGSISERIFLKCAHYDPVAGRYNVAVMSVVRTMSLAVLAALALWIWRRGRAS